MRSFFFYYASGGWRLKKRDIRESFSHFNIYSVWSWSESGVRVWCKWTCFSISENSRAPGLQYCNGVSSARRHTSEHITIKVSNISRLSLATVSGEESVGMNVIPICACDSVTLGLYKLLKKDSNLELVFLTPLRRYVCFNEASHNILPLSGSATLGSWSEGVVEIDGVPLYQTLPLYFT